MIADNDIKWLTEPDFWKEKNKQKKNNQQPEFGQMCQNLAQN